MRQIKILAVMLALGLTLTLVAAPPAQAVVPEHTNYITFPSWVFINSPLDLSSGGVACIDFDQDTVNWNDIWEDRGPYEITMVDGTITHVTGVVNPNIGLLFQGKLNIRGLVDRKGPGSTFAFVGSGKLKSFIFAVPPTRTNVTGMAIQDPFGFCSGVPDSATRGSGPNWVRAD